MSWEGVIRGKESRWEEWKLGQMKRMAEGGHDEERRIGSEGGMEEWK